MIYEVLYCKICRKDVDYRRRGYSSYKPYYLCPKCHTRQTEHEVRDLPEGVILVWDEKEEI